MLYVNIHLMQPSTYNNNDLKKIPLRTYQYGSQWSEINDFVKLFFLILIHLLSRFLLKVNP